MSRRGVPLGPNLARFERHSRRAKIDSHEDVVITAATYLRALEITVITKATLLSTLNAEAEKWLADSLKEQGR